MSDIQTAIVVVFVISIGIGYIFYRIKFRKNRQAKKLLKNPDKLAEELNKHGKIYSIGKDSVRDEVKIESRIDEKTGKKRLHIEIIPGKKPEPKKEVKPEKKVKKVSKAHGKK